VPQRERVRAKGPNRVERYEATQGALEKAAGVVLQELIRARVIRAKEARVNVTVLSHAQMTALKRRALTRMSSQKRKEEQGHFPNVLAFPEPPGFPHPEVSGRLLGEVYLNASVLAKEGMPRFVYLMIHGILHCCGYDHIRRRDMIVMERWERCLMKVLYEKRLT
jgi:ssRNA-specific RNase YbeY (16S rRNA maturation enzyme)